MCIRDSAGSDQCPASFTDKCAEECADRGSGNDSQGAAARTFFLHEIGLNESCVDRAFNITGKLD